jgi:hypothetical protein
MPESHRLDPDMATAEMQMGPAPRRSAPRSVVAGKRRDLVDTSWSPGLAVGHMFYKFVVDANILGSMN